MGNKSPHSKSSFKHEKVKFCEISYFIQDPVEKAPQAQILYKQFSSDSP